MKTLIAAICMLALAATSYGQPAKRIDSLMEFYSQSLNYNGVAFVSQKGKTIYSKGFGYKDKDKNIMNDANGIYQIGSITKQFTSEIILMLAKEHKLDVQDKLTKYYPDYKSGDKITLENLLTHTSGIYNYTEDTFWKKYPTQPLTREQMMGIFKDKPLEFEPGSKFEYSNSNYILLSNIIEKITGKTYEQVARERILTPRGMTSSGFDFTHLKDARKVMCYNSIGMNANYVDSFYYSPIEDSSQSYGAGSMYSTTADMYKWHRALLEHKLLDKAWQDRAYTPFKDNYGYAWFINEKLVKGKKMVAHSGRISGFCSYILRIESDDLCIILLSNVAFGSDVNDIAKSIVKCIYDPAFKIPAVRKEISLSSEIIKRYVGDYALTLDTSVSIHFELKGKYLIGKVIGQEEDRLLPQSENMFFTKLVDARFEFVKDDKGGYKLVLHQHGQEFEALKK